MGEDRSVAFVDALQVKAIVGGGFEDKRWTRAVDDLKAALREMDAVPDAPFTVTVTFVIPGEVFAPRSAGIRIVSLLEDFRSVIVHVPVPANPVNDARAELLDLLDKAIAESETSAKQKGFITAPLTAARGAAAHLRRSGSPDPPPAPTEQKGGLRSWVRRWVTPA